MSELVAGGWLPADEAFGGIGQSQLTTASRPGAFQAGGIGVVGAKLQNLPFFEVRNYYRERFGPDGSQEVVVRMATPWSQRKSFVDQMLGFSSTIRLGGTNHLLRTIPYQCPELGYEHLYASECNLVEPQGVFANAGIVPNDAQGNQLKAANGLPLFVDWPAWYSDKPLWGPDGCAEYDVVFRPRPYEVRTDGDLDSLTAGELERYVYREKRAALQGQPLPSSGLIYVDGPQAGQSLPASAAFLFVYTEELLYHWYQVPDEPIDAIKACVGKVNANPFDGARGAPTYPAETLLCQAPVKRQRYRHTTGRIYWDITYSFLYRPNGWNYYVASDGNYYLVTNGGTAGGARVYKSADFA